MKRYVLIVVLLSCIALLTTSCVSGGDVTITSGDIVQIVGGNGVASESATDVNELPSHHVSSSVGDNQPGSSPSMWVYVLIFPLFIVGIWLIYIIIKVYRNRKWNN